MAENRITVHMIGQAHIDPIWLWPWQSGLDEVLATCRSACDLLDDYEEFIFTRGEAWAYQQVEMLDPELFARIRRHVENGRWEIVGGWWLQPDCNLPSGFGFERQIAFGKEYFLNRFGTFPEVAYNVDSFGHAATLPGYMHAAGQRFYVMMRPQEHEKALPARLFRWRGYEDGPEVTTFRIAGAYTTGLNLPSEAHIKHALTELPQGITHTMCFYGVGDHGGGPTEDAIRWIHAHQDAFPGCRLEFSSPARFFKAIEGQIAELPLVTGELQHHAIGCYSVMRGIKTRVRRAEQQLRQAEILVNTETPNTYETAQLHDAWERVVFNHFHDILGGTSIASAYRQAYDQLGYASSIADTIMQYGLRKKMAALPNDPLQRVVLYNASDSVYDGYAEFEPWTQGRARAENIVLLDEAGSIVPHQLIPQEAATWGAPRLLARVTLQPGELRALKLGTSDQVTQPEARVTASVSGVMTAQGTGLSVATGEFHFPGGLRLPLPRFDVIEDRSDNWSHAIDRYPEGPVTSPVWNAPSIICRGPLMASLMQTGSVGHSSLHAEWRVYANEPYVELLLRVHWAEANQLLKMTLGLPTPVATRRDGIPGGSLLREIDGCERPLRDWTLLAPPDASALGVVCPDIYALDGTAERLRFTLLRSPVLTHHAPGLGMTPNAVHTDQGVHHFRFRFFLGDDVTASLLDQQALMLQRPLLMADLTRGMPRRNTQAN